MSSRHERLLDILESHGGRIHTLLTRLTLCESTAEDLLQDLFIRLSKSDSFDRAQNQTAYAVRAAANLAFDWRRKQRRAIRAQSLVGEPVARQRPPSDVLEHREQCARVLSALDAMPELSRQVVVLHRLEGESYDAIASHLGKTPHQVRAICSKALAQLRRSLGSLSSFHSEDSR